MKEYLDPMETKEKQRKRISELEARKRQKKRKPKRKQNKLAFYGYIFHIYIQMCL